MTTSIYTIGHSNHTWESFSRLLVDNEVELLVDVRSNPVSRFAPFANHRVLAGPSRVCRNRLRADGRDSWRKARKPWAVRLQGKAGLPQDAVAGRVPGRGRAASGDGVAPADGRPVLRGGPVPVSPAASPGAVSRRERVRAACTSGATAAFREQGSYRWARNTVSSFRVRLEYRE